LEVTTMVTMFLLLVLLAVVVLREPIANCLAARREERLEQLRRQAEEYIRERIPVSREPGHERREQAVLKLAILWEQLTQRR
jgi:hypothetical protein